jgi:hypothetical protein
MELYCTPKTQHTTANYSQPLFEHNSLITTITPLRPFTSDPKAQLNSKALPYTYPTAVTIVMLTATNPLLCNMTVTLLWKCNELIVTQQELLRYYTNATKDLTCHNIK